MSEIEKTTRSRERLLLLAPMAVEAAALRWASPGVTVVRTGVGPERAAAAAAFAPAAGSSGRGRRLLRRADR